MRAESSPGYIHSDVHCTFDWLVGSQASLGLLLICVVFPACSLQVALKGFVSAGVIQQGQDGKDAAAAAKEAAARAALQNPEEIDVDIGDDDGGDGGGRGDGVDQQGGGGGAADDDGEMTEVTTKAVPAAVFGSLAAKVAAEQEAAVGALDRFKKRRVQ